MIVFDLKCGAGHVFEAWFASSDAFGEQRYRRLIACPVCGHSAVEKAVMAPNVAVARQGFDGLMKGEASVFAGSLASKAMGRLSAVTPGPVAAKLNRQMTEPGSAED